MSQKIRIGFSPCPNDTFMFDAMVNGKIDTDGIEFELVMKDVEELNQMALRSELDITKISFHAFAHLTDSYALLHSGSALGNNCGPLLITTPENKERDPSIMTIAIPGKYTTANFLLSLAYPSATNKYEMLFSEIESSVLEGKVDAGLIIHENRFTYSDKGLVKIIDLGEYWETKTGLPIPLGGIVASRSLDSDLANKIDTLLAESIRYAFEHASHDVDFVAEHAQEMSLDVVKQHIDLYVNNYSIDLGTTGKEAISTLLETAKEKGVISDYNPTIFVS